MIVSKEKRLQGVCTRTRKILTSNFYFPDLSQSRWPSYQLALRVFFSFLRATLRFKCWIWCAWTAYYCRSYWVDVSDFTDSRRADLCFSSHYYLARLIWPLVYSFSTVYSLSFSDWQCVSGSFQSQLTLDNQRLSSFKFKVYSRRVVSSTMVMSFFRRICQF